MLCLLVPSLLCSGADFLSFDIISLSFAACFFSARLYLPAVASFDNN